MSLADFVANPGLDEPAARAAAARLLPDAGFRLALEAIVARPDYTPTRLVELPELARRTGIGQLYVKDESERFGLGSFKAVGGAYAVYRLLARLVAQARGATPSPTELMTGAHDDVTEAITVTCATAGNHGRSVASGARTFGCQCVIYLHRGVSESREGAIRAFGAEIIRAGATYDESVAACAQDAEREGRIVVSDTDLLGAPQGVLDIMQGYRVVVDEALRQLPSGAPPTHVLVQVGCGGFGASVAAHLLGRQGAAPAIVAVEPMAAACLAASIRAGRPTRVDGDLETVMAGMAVGQVSHPAWAVLSGATRSVIAVSDRAAEDAMRQFAAGVGHDPPLVSGESGAAGLAGLHAAAANVDARAVLGLGPDSSVLLFSTEGATDAAIYERIVGEAPAAVAAASARSVHDYEEAKP